MSDPAGATAASAATGEESAFPQAPPGGDCAVDRPPLRLVVPGREAACHYSEEVLGV